MSRPIEQIDANAFYELLRERRADGAYAIAIEGGTLPVRVRLKNAPGVVFTFSGAVDRALYTLPRFSSVALSDHVPASVIAIADPALERSDDLTLAWYAGYDGLPLQSLLPGIFQRMIESLDARRAAFVGSSGGGFAALYYAWHAPGSVAVVSNPQTILQNYFRAHRQRYAAACWPAFPEGTPLSEMIDANLGRLYRDGFENAVVYLQVANDFFHLRRHFAPFMKDQSGSAYERMIVRMDTWGIQGHRPAPADVWIPWLDAALTAPDISAESITATWAAANAQPRPARAPASSPSSRDEQIASELARAAIEALLTQQAPNGIPS